MEISLKYERALSDYKQYLKHEREMSPNSLEAYIRDIKNFLLFLTQKGIEDIRDITNTDIVSYILNLKNEGRSSSTVNRRIAAIRTFCNYFHSKGVLKSNPALNIRSPQIEKKKPEYLTIEEVENLISLPDTNTPKGKRDKAILELLYATGIRVSELVEMNVEDINLRMGFSAFTGEHGKARIIPLGGPSRAAIEEYLSNSRKILIKNNEGEIALFVNYTGERITRQGLWKLLKYYAQKADIDTPITPQIIRHSFGVHMLQNGADLKSLQELMGHEDISTTQIYLDATKSRIKEVYDRAHPRA